MRAAALFLLVSYCVAGSFAAHARSMGSFGASYNIVEKDAVQEMKEMAAKVDWDNVQKSTWKRARDRHFRPINSTVKLPKAGKNKKYLVDMTYSLEWDVYGLDGKVLYPKGYRINPGDILRMDHVPVLIDGDDPSQIKWFRRKWGNRGDVALMVTEGDPIGLMEKLGRKVFWANDLMVRRFRLEHVPCAIRQVGNMIEIEEFYVTENMRKK